MDRYEVQKRVGDGTYGYVELVRLKEPPHNKFAVKVMKKAYTSWDQCMQLREIKSLKKLKHPNIIALKEVIRENNTLYMVFEFMQGNLYELMKDRKRTPPESEVRNITYKMLQGLAYMHKMGFFHRDMKPENVLCNGSDVIKIADFGLAREIRSKPPYTDYVSTRWYRAPEVLLRSLRYNSPVDLWAIGTMMSEMYTLRPLFPGDSEPDMLYRVTSVLGTPSEQLWPEGHQLAHKLKFKFKTMAPTPLRKLIPQAGKQGLDLMSKLMMWNPSHRPTCIEALNHPYFVGCKPDQMPQPNQPGVAQPAPAPGNPKTAVSVNSSTKAESSISPSANTDKDAKTSNRNEPNINNNDIYNKGIVNNQEQKHVSNTHMNINTHGMQNQHHTQSTQPKQHVTQGALKGSNVQPPSFTKQFTKQSPTPNFDDTLEEAAFLSEYISNHAGANATKQQAPVQSSNHNKSHLSKFRKDRSNDSLFGNGNGHNSASPISFSPSTVTPTFFSPTSITPSYNVDKGRKSAKAPSNKLNPLSSKFDMVGGKVSPYSSNFGKKSISPHSSLHNNHNTHSNKFSRSSPLVSGIKKDENGSYVLPTIDPGKLGRHANQTRYVPAGGALPPGNPYKAVPRVGSGRNPWGGKYHGNNSNALPVKGSKLDQDTADALDSLAALRRRYSGVEVGSASNMGTRQRQIRAPNLRANAVNKRTDWASKYGK